MNANFLPKTLTLANHQLAAAGPGRVAGSALYIDHARSLPLELFLTEVSHSGPQFSISRALGNERLGTIRVEHCNLIQPPNVRTPLQARLRTLLLVGPLSFQPNGRAFAQHAWFLSLPRCGLIHSVTHNHDGGTILQERSGELITFRRSTLTPSTELRPNQRVRFSSYRGPHGNFVVSLVHAA